MILTLAVCLRRLYYSVEALRSDLVILLQFRSLATSFWSDQGKEIGFGLESTKNTLSNAALIWMKNWSLGGRIDWDRLGQCSQGSSVRPNASSTISWSEVRGDVHLSALMLMDSAWTRYLPSDKDGVYRRCDVCLRIYTFGHSAIKKQITALGPIMPAFHHLASK